VFEPFPAGTRLSLPVRNGAEIHIVSVKTIPITDVAKMRFLSLNQSGGRCRVGSRVLYGSGTGSADGWVAAGSWQLVHV
jgi:hypothetical protein